MFCIYILHSKISTAEDPAYSPMSNRKEANASVLATDYAQNIPAGRVRTVLVSLLLIYSVSE